MGLSLDEKCADECFGWAQHLPHNMLPNDLDPLAPVCARSASLATVSVVSTWPTGVCCIMPSPCPRCPMVLSFGGLRPRSAPLSTYFARHKTLAFASSRELFGRHRSNPCLSFHVFYPSIST